MNAVEAAPPVAPAARQAPPRALDAPPGAAPAVVAPAPAPTCTDSLATGHIQMTKPGITRHVTITSGVGFALAAINRPWAPLELGTVALATLLGTALSAAGANALNQWMERGRDATMLRTQTRPLPTGAVSPTAGLLFGAGCSLAGVLALRVGVNQAAAAIALATTALYLLLYTPLKTRTPLATIVGAVPGALPILIGWSAADASGDGWRSLASPAGWSLFAIMFFWQAPHFLAIAWMHKDDYAKGGFKPLPVVDPTGDRTARACLIWTGLTVIASVLPPILMPDRLGFLTVLFALLAGAGFLASAARFAHERTRTAARRLFLASIAYLPIVLAIMVVDAMIARFALGG